MESKSVRVIEASRFKVIVIVVGALCFVVLGAWLSSNDPENILNLVVGIASIVFFGLVALVGGKKLFDSTAGLVLNHEGVLDNSSGISAGKIPWSEIVEVRENTVQAQRFVSIYVKEPEKYASKGNALQRMAHRANIRMVGTPINISSNGLKVGHEELLSIIQSFFNESRDGA